jgi:hypothetical protein
MFGVYLHADIPYSDRSGASGEGGVAAVPCRGERASVIPEHSLNGLHLPRRTPLFPAGT